MTSPQMQFIIDTLRARPQPAAEPTFDEMRRGMEALASTNTPPTGAEFRSETVAGVPCEWSHVPDTLGATRTGESGVMLYLHGGGYVMGSIATHRAMVARIAAASGTRALSVDYRLAPEHPFPAGLEDAVAVYKALLERGHAPDELFVAGDSAGGGLAVATLLELRAQGIPLPAASILLSPWLDLSLSGASMDARAEHDPMVQRRPLARMADAYRGALHADAPSVSPLFADLSGLPPSLIQVGTAEVLLDDSTRFLERARAASLDTDLQVSEDLVHVFQFFAPLVPEANEAIARIGEFVRKHL